MKKIISLILVTTMVLSSVSSSFAYFTVNKDKCRYITYFNTLCGGAVGIGNCEDNNISKSFPETVQTCEESQDCVVYKGGKLKFKDKVLFIPKEKTEEALRQVEKLMDKEELTKDILSCVGLFSLSVSPYICLCVRFIRDLKKLENEFGLTDLKKELKATKIELKEKRKRHEDCSMLQNKVKELKNRLNKQYREFNRKYSNCIECKFLKSLFLGCITGLGIVRALTYTSIEKAEEFVDKFSIVNLETIRSIISNAKDGEDSVAVRLCKKDRVIAAQVPGKVYVDTEECDFLGLRSKNREDINKN